MKSLMFASLLLVACNQMYGLDETRARDAFEQFADADQDSVADTKDNCKFVANFDQRDDDIDGIGNACDTCEACEPCSKEPLHDEDRDHISDLCDPCPADDSNTDSDGDGIGDACEHSDSTIGAVPQQRAIFDGFHQTTADWLERGARWEIANDMVTVKSGFVDDRFEYIRVETLPASTNWYIETAVTLTDVTQRSAGIYLLPTVGGNGQFNCWLARFDATQYRLLNSGTPGGLITLADGPVRLRYAAENPVGGTQRFRCSVVGTTHEVLVSVGAVAYPLSMRLYSDRSGVAFSYFELVTP